MLPPEEEPEFGEELMDCPFELPPGPAVITPEEVLPEEVPPELVLPELVPPELVLPELVSGPPTVTVEEPLLETPLPIPAL